MLRYQGRDCSQCCQVDRQLEVQRVVVRVVQSLVRQIELTFGFAAKEVFGVEHFFDAVTNSEVRPVHMTGDDENYRDRQVVVSHIRQPQRFGLRMEPTQKCQNCCSCTFGRAKHMVCCVRVVRVSCPISRKEWC